MFYEFIYDRNDCPEGLDKKLKENQTCRMKNIAADFQLFSIPLPFGELNFNTRTMKFELNGQSVKEEPTLTFYNEKAVLQIGGQDYDFAKINSCFLLLKKIHDLLLPEDCPNTTYDYFFLQIYDDKNKIKKNQEIPRKGKIDISSLDNIKLKGSSKEISISFVKQESAVSKGFSVYENKKNIWVSLYTAEGERYNFYINSWMGCLEKVKNQLDHGMNSCLKKDKNSFYYYRRFDIQNGQEDDLQGEIEILKFLVDKGTVEEYDMKNHLLNSIRVVYMKMIDEKGESWLYIKGIDGKDETVNKKYFMRMDKKSCSAKFSAVEEAFKR
jgi:hypothetical protein